MPYITRFFWNRTRAHIAMAYYDPYTFENNSLRLLYHSSKAVDENPLKMCGLSGLYMRTILYGYFIIPASLRWEPIKDLWSIWFIHEHNSCMATLSFQQASRWEPIEDFWSLLVRIHARFLVLVYDRRTCHVSLCYSTNCSGLCTWPCNKCT